MRRATILLTGAASLALLSAPLAAQLGTEPDPSRLIGGAPTDGQIQSALNHELRVSGITAQFQSGVATLEGSVQSQSEKHLAEMSARRVDGVKSVRNRLTVRPQ